MIKIASGNDTLHISDERLHTANKMHVIVAISAFITLVRPFKLYVYDHPYKLVYNDGNLSVVTKNGLYLITSTPLGIAEVICNTWQENRRI